MLRLQQNLVPWNGEHDGMCKFIFHMSFRNEFYFSGFYRCVKGFLLCYSMNYRGFSVKSKLLISLFQTVKVSL